MAIVHQHIKILLKLVHIFGDIFFFDFQIAFGHHVEFCLLRGLEGRSLSLCQILS